MDNKPALNLFESIEPNGTVELEGLGTVNLSHFPYREDLASVTHFWMVFYLFLTSPHLSFTSLAYTTVVDVLDSKV